MSERLLEQHQQQTKLQSKPEKGLILLGMVHLNTCKTLGLIYIFFPKMFPFFDNTEVKKNPSNSKL